MKTKLILTSAILMLATPALADEAMAPPSSVAWTGFYVGAQAGYGWARDKIHDESRSTPGTSDYSDRFNMDGLTGGVHAGYNYQINTWVVGLEGDAELADVNGDNSAWPFGDNSTAKIRAQGSIRARAGYVYGQTLLYVTGGLALADIKTEYFDAGNVDSYSKVKAGWTLGAGVECAFTQNWTARIEYRYADFGRITDWTRTTDSGWDEHNDITEHAVRVGVSYKF